MRLVLVQITDFQYWVFYLRKHQLLLTVSTDRAGTFTVNLFERRAAGVMYFCMFWCCLMLYLYKVGCFRVTGLDDVSGFCLFLEISMVLILSKDL